MAALDEYFTLASSGLTELRVSASRFFGFAEHVPNEASAAQMRIGLKKKYHDATHQPFAYRLANGRERSSDDGEPKGTAGASILTQIQADDLFDVQIVVVRYFGGTKLGKGGLARAFSQCAQMVLENSGRKKCWNRRFICIEVAPETVSLAKAIAAKFGATVESLSYGIRARVQFAVPNSLLDDCRQTLADRLGPEIFKSGS